MGLKKIISTAFKNVEQKSKLDLITEVLIEGNSTEEALKLFNKVKANFLFEMDKREKKCAHECRLINTLATKERKEYDANFDKRIADLEVEYEFAIVQ